MQNFKPVFDALAAGVVAEAKLDCSWAIPAPPAGEKVDQGLVNMRATPGQGDPYLVLAVSNAAECGAAGGWYYDDSATAQEVKVCPSTCATLQADAQASIDIVFGCETAKQTVK